MDASAAHESTRCSHILPPRRSGMHKCTQEPQALVAHVPCTLRCGSESKNSTPNSKCKMAMAIVMMTSMMMIMEDIFPVGEMTLEMPQGRHNGGGHHRHCQASLPHTSARLGPILEASWACRWSAPTTHSSPEPQTLQSP
jgi:hypothetical protein